MQYHGIFFICLLFILIPLFQNISIGDSSFVLGIYNCAILRYLRYLDVDMQHKRNSYVSYLYHMFLFLYLSIRVRFVPSLMRVAPLMMGTPLAFSLSSKMMFSAESSSLNLYCWLSGNLNTQRGMSSEQANHYGSIDNICN